MSILSLHHITIVCQNAQRISDFYTRVLGLRLVKRTVNFDAPTTYHLYFGNETASPGSLITFFEWPNAARGAPGIGGTHHFALQVADYENLLRWKRRLVDLGFAVKGPVDRHFFTSIYVADPDGTIVELATTGEIGATEWDEPVPEILPSMRIEKGMHHITAIGQNIQATDDFYNGILGMRLVRQSSDEDDPGARHWAWGVGDGAPGTLITYFERSPEHEKPVRMGAGQTHHFALAVKDEESQLEWRDKLRRSGVQVTPVMDRVYFKSIYMHDPDGHIVELATLDPGFFVDESAQNLGESLQLPPWLAGSRDRIEPALSPINVPKWRSTEREAAGV